MMQSHLLKEKCGRGQEEGMKRQPQQIGKGHTKAAQWNHQARAIESLK